MLGGQKTWVLAPWVMAAALAGASCTDYRAYCEEAVDCAEGNDLDIDACVESEEAKTSLADEYGCGEWRDALQECVDSNARCENKVFAIRAGDCDEEQLDYSGCMSK